MTSFAADTELRLRKAQAGDTRELGLLLEEHLPFVKRIAALNLGRRLAELEAVEDVMQEAMMRALRGLEQFTYTSPGSFRRWLGRIVENEVRDLGRYHGAGKRDGARLRALPEMESRILVDSVLRGREPTPSQAYSAVEVAEQIEAALLGLEERERRAVVMRRMGDADYDVIAEELGLGGESSARSLVTRALAKLSAKL